jgi:hypothetical protein
MVGFCRCSGVSSGHTVLTAVCPSKGLGLDQWGALHGEARHHDFIIIERASDEVHFRMRYPPKSREQG